MSNLEIFEDVVEDLVTLLDELDNDEAYFLFSSIFDFTKLHDYDLRMLLRNKDVSKDYHILMNIDYSVLPAKSINFGIQFFENVIEEIYEKIDSFTGTDNKQHGPLGKVAFPFARVNKRNVELEKNTDIEDELFFKLESHFLENQKFDKKTFDLMIKLAKSKKYPDMFSLSKSKTIYRGMMVHESYVHNLNKGDSFLFSPKDYISSWTTNLNAARNFLGTYFEKNVRAIILKANSNNNNSENWLDCSGFYNLLAISDFKDEKEVIVAGKIKATLIHIKESL